MTTVALINPADNSSIEPMVYPPLGLLYIASILERNGYRAILYDLREDSDIHRIKEHDIYCFTATTSQINQTVNTSRYLRRIYKDKFHIIGGPHASFMAETLTDTFDVIIIGSGEYAVLSAILYRKPDILSMPLTSLNDIPFPSRHLMKPEHIATNLLWEGHRYGTGPIATTITASRGCPHKCSFCANIPRKVLLRDHGDIASEIEELQKTYNCNHFRFLDDNLLLNKKWLRNLSEELHDLRIEFRCSVRSDSLDEEFCDMLDYAGCKEIGFGVECADDRVLSAIDKKETASDHANSIALAKKYKFKTKAFFMVGLPFETEDTIKKNKHFISTVKPDKVIVTLFTPYPGSDIFDSPDKYGVRILTKHWNRYVQTSPTRSIIETNYGKPKDFERRHMEMIRFIS